MKTALSLMIGTILFFDGDIRDHSKSTGTCPTITLNAEYTVVEGKPAVFMVTISDTSVYKPAQLTYNWTVSNGTIETGQGTNIIAVGTRGLADQPITATLEVGRLKKECTNVKSITVTVVAVP